MIDSINFSVPKNLESHWKNINLVGLLWHEPDVCVIPTLVYFLPHKTRLSFYLVSRLYKQT